MSAFTHTYYVEGAQKQVLIQPWHKGDPPPKISRRMSEDTETELIRVDALTPKPVVIGFYSPEYETAYMVDWESTDEFYTYLLEKCHRLWGYNTAFDIDTSGTDKAYEALKRGILCDVRCNLFMYWFSVFGDVRYDCLDLESCAKNIIHMFLDKGKDKGDDADRLTFVQGVEPTKSQLVYLGGDIVSTYYLGEKYAEMPTLSLQTKADYVLSKITKNGIPVDRDVMHYWQRVAQAEMDEAAAKLKAYGYPVKEAVKTIGAQWNDLWARCGHAAPAMPNKETIRALMADTWSLIKTTEELTEETRKPLMEEFLSSGALKLDKARKPVLMEFLVSTDTVAYNTSTKDNPFKLLFMELIRLVFLDKAEPVDIIAGIRKWSDDHVSLLDNVKPIGPVKFMQDYLSNMMAQNPGLHFESTESGKQLKFSKDDMWMLEDAGAKSEFLEAYAQYKHMEKFIGTYLKDEFIWPDGKMHPRYKILVRSGRTASGGNSKCRWYDGKEVEIPGPNAQNYPSRDPKYLLRNMFAAPEGYAFCCTDYTGSELMSLAQDCYTRYGQSRLRELINAGVDVHYWFAGVIKGLIDPRTFDINNVDVKELLDMLHANVTKAERSFAKEPNFGLPGGLGVRTFYKRLRIKGFKVTEKETKELIELWKTSFPEMKHHFVADVADPVDTRYYGRVVYTDEEGQTEDTFSDQKYQSTTITGRKRNNCTYCSAVNGRFQGFSADVIKYALWNLYEAGFGPYIVNEVHDEADLILPLEKIKEWVPFVERIMFASAQQMLPDIRVSGETTVSLYWDKGGTPFNELEYDSDGKPILEVPEYIRELKQKNAVVA